MVAILNKGLLTCVVALGATLVHAQSMNIDFNFNGAGVVPNSTYGAAGNVGVWNNANVAPNTISNLALVDLSGAGTTALLNAPTILGNWTNTGTWLGDDNLLMEDSGGSGGTFLSVMFSGLLNGNYDVLTYGMAASGNLNSTFMIGNATQNTGGSWSGSHVLGASYGQFNPVSVTNGTMTIRWAGNFNGVQLSYSPVPEPASMTALALGFVALIKRKRKLGSQDTQSCR